MTVPDEGEIHAAWLPAEAFAPLGARRIAVVGDGLLTDTVRREAEQACVRFGGTVRAGAEIDDHCDVVLALSSWPDPLPLPPTAAEAIRSAVAEDPGPEGFVLARRDGVTVLLAGGPAGLLYGFFHLVRLGRAAFGADRPPETHRPAMPLRMVDHWDNVAVHDMMGQVERGYSGGSIFWSDGALQKDLTRVRAYGRLLAATGVNAVSVNNVNVHAVEARLLTDRLDDVAALAEELRPHGIRVHLSVDFASPVVLGGLPTADPLDAAVRDWWAQTTVRVYERVPDFGGYVVKADSEGQAGPFAYGRSHADGANMLADALAPHGGVVHWRAFVYNHRQDWRDRSTDRARAAHDHFVPLDGRFRDTVILQVKHGPIDFQSREPVSPLLAAMPNTRVAVEVQATQEYTGQQRHVCYLAPMWREVLGFRPWGADGAAMADVVAGLRPDGERAGGERTGGEGAGAEGAGGGLVAVSNVGDDRFWTGHPLAQANLYAFGRLAWDPFLEPTAILDEWIGLTFTRGAAGVPEPLRRTLHAIMDDSWRTYERYTAPLGVGFMVRPADHYGPGVDGYEYTQWGTYHFADRDGIGVDRTVATGTGFAAQYPEPWSGIYESLERCPDELLLFFHHVPYTHVLHSGVTVIQHIYDTHFEGAEQAHEMRSRWQDLEGTALVDADVQARVAERLNEQVRCAEEWRDQINTYFLRKSGIPDAHGRKIY
jgi:alpha-glucuronidase